MKIDPAIRDAILLQVQETPANAAVGEIVIPGVDRNVILEHIEQLTVDGLLKADLIPNGMSPTPRIYLAHVRGLTAAGRRHLARRSESGGA